jgi:hypothetical protein
MPKTDLRDILIHGENFELQGLTPKACDKIIKRCLEYKQIIRERKRYDPKLNDFYFRRYQDN